MEKIWMVTMMMDWTDKEHKEYEGTCSTSEVRHQAWASGLSPSL